MKERVRQAQEKTRPAISGVEKRAETGSGRDERGKNS
jgi:hypothetical protein